MNIEHLFVCRWVCEACGHHNPYRYLRCRQCKTVRPPKKPWDPVADS